MLLDAESAEPAPVRGRRLVDVVQVSYGLPQPGQQRLVAALSVFAGPFTVADAQAVSG